MEPEWWQLAPGYIVYFFMYSFLYYPPTQDIVLFAFYFFYDFGSATDIYVEDHENGWTFWASIQGGLAVLTVAYYIMLLIMRYVLGITDIFSNYIY